MVDKTVLNGLCWCARCNHEMYYEYSPEVEGPWERYRCPMCGNITDDTIVFNQGVDKKFIKLRETARLPGSGADKLILYHLIRFEGLSISDSARRLGIPIRTACSWWGRIKARYGIRKTTY